MTGFFYCKIFQIMIVFLKTQRNTKNDYTAENQKFCF